MKNDIQKFINDHFDKTITVVRYNGVMADEDGDLFSDHDFLYVYGDYETVLEINQGRYLTLADFQNKGIGSYIFEVENSGFKLLKFYPE